MPPWRQSMARSSAAALWRSTKRVRAKSGRAHLAATGGTPIFAGGEIDHAAGHERVEAGCSSTIIGLANAMEIDGAIMSVLPGTMLRVAVANERLLLADISAQR